MKRSIPSVKTAISLRRPLYEQVDKLAREMSVPRSQVFVLALEAYVIKYQNRLLLQEINKAFADKPEANEQKRLKTMRQQHRRVVEGTW
jgi:metal-responsive CopG/Arc/MetJ family transcriptional regulator